MKCPELQRSTRPLTTRLSPRPFGQLDHTTHNITKTKAGNFSDIVREAGTVCLKSPAQPSEKFLCLVQGKFIQVRTACLWQRILINEIYILKVNNSQSAASQISCLGRFPRFAQDMAGLPEEWAVQGATIQDLYHVQLINARNNLSGECTREKGWQ